MFRSAVVLVLTGGAFAARAQAPAASTPAVTPSGVTQPAAATPDAAAKVAPQFEPRSWSGHFETWIERTVLREEIDAARRGLPATAPDAAFHVLDELVGDAVDAADRVEPFPEALLPPLSARNLKGKALEAARIYARGDHDEALLALGTADAYADPDAAHLRAELRDAASHDAAPPDRLAVIDAYRFALSLSRGTEVAARARVRIAQIDLELGLRIEAAAALQPHLEQLPPPYDVMARLTFAEAVFRSQRYAEAAAALEAVSTERMSPAVLRWWVGRRGDSYFHLGQYAKAAEAYQAKLPADGAQEAEAFDALRTLHLSYALIHSERDEDARRELDAALAFAPRDPLAPLLALLRVQTYLAQRDLSAIVDAGAKVLASYPDTDTATLAAAYWLEARRLRHDRIDLPKVVRDRIDLGTSRSTVGLLTWQVERLRGESQELKSLPLLGKMARNLPPGSVRQLVHGWIAERLLTRLSERALRGDPSPPELLDALAALLDPRTLDENALLVSLEALRDGHRFATCEAWAAELREREVRPVRRGVGAFREMQCARERARSFTVNRMFTLAEGGTLGPFSIAFSALGAEMLLQRGQFDSGLGAYERSLEAIAEPQLLGPVLLRTGELHAVAGRDSLALRRLVRGLTVTDSQATVTDPFRKAGIVLLGDIAKRTGKTVRFAAFLQRDLPQVEDPWWRDAYAYLGYRVGLPLRPDAKQGVFARGVAQLEAADQLSARLRSAAGLPEPAAAGAGAQP